MYDSYNTYGTYGASSSDLSTVFAVLGGFIIFIGIICLAIAILQIVASWKTLEKGKQPGWGAIIPIYNTYLFCKLSGVNPWWILITILAPVLNLVPIIGPLAVVVIEIYFNILLAVSIARAFGKEDTFAIGLLLLPVVFYPILGFGKAEYVGANPMNDIIFKKAESAVANAANTNTSNPVDNEKYCPKCGYRVANDAKFCPKCGQMF